MRITIIGQWIYPANTPRAHRTWNLAQEFAKQGHSVTLYALLGKMDYSCYAKENLQIRSLGHAFWGCSNSDLKQEYSNSILRFIYKVIQRLMGYFLYFPEIELFFLTRKALLQEEETDLLITIAYPHSIHWGAASCQNYKKNKVWIADCGDPFFSPFSKHPFYFRIIEKFWTSKVDAITVPVESAIDGYNSSCHPKISIIPQGFDFSDVKTATYIPNAVPTFAFAGSVFKNTRDPSSFLNFLASLEFDFKFIVYTKDKLLFSGYKRLENKMEIREYISRNDLIYELSKVDFLINISNAGTVQTPSKLIDYTLTQRPILTISSQFHENEQFFEFIQANYSRQTEPCKIENYEIKNIVDKFVKLHVSLLHEK